MVKLLRQRLNLKDCAPELMHAPYFGKVRYVYCSQIQILKTWVWAMQNWRFGLGIIITQLFEWQLAGIAQSVEHQALGHKVMGLNLPAILEVTMGSHSSNSLTIPRWNIWTRPRRGNSELTLRIITCKREQSAESTEVWNREYQRLHKMVTCHRKIEK